MVHLEAHQHVVIRNFRFIEVNQDFENSERNMCGCINRSHSHVIASATNPAGTTTGHIAIPAAGETIDDQTKIP